jgi:hypothetical protein
MSAFCLMVTLVVKRNVLEYTGALLFNIEIQWLYCKFGGRIAFAKLRMRVNPLDFFYRLLFFPFSK